MSPTRPTTGRRSRRVHARRGSRATTSCSGPDEWYAEQRVELLTRTSVMTLDVERARRDAVEQGRGAASRRRCSRPARTCTSCTSTARSWTGSTTCARSATADALAEELADAERVALIGGSYIGTELAASFTKLGKQCELVMLEAVTHERFYGPEVGRFFQDVLDRARREGARRAGARALRGRGSGPEGRDQVRPRDRVRLRRDRRRRHPGPHARRSRRGSRPTAAC